MGYGHADGVQHDENTEQRGQVRFDGVTETTAKDDENRYEADQYPPTRKPLTCL